MPGSTPPDSILVRFGELSLKDRNRGRFIRRLKQNVERRISDLDHDGVERFPGGFFVRCAEDTGASKLTERLRTVPGIAWHAPGWELERDPERLARRALEEGSQRLKTAGSFAVRTHRSDKDFPLTSVEFNERIGQHVQQQTGLDVDLERPDCEIHVQVLFDRAHLFFRRVEGMGGLPVGTTGEVLVLLSGGIDSPVAAVHSHLRGCRNDYLHFYPYPDARTALEQKMGTMIERLSRFGTRGTLHMVPYHPFELGTSECSPRLDVVLFRRHTLRVAEKIARREGHQALVTGENLGQVASQTMENMITIAGSTRFPVLRPLVGMNKQEIIRRAREWDTYECSIASYQDCCAIQSSHPKTRTDPDRVRSVERKHNLREVDEEAFRSAVSFRYDSSGRISAGEPLAG